MEKMLSYLFISLLVTSACSTAKTYAPSHPSKGASVPFVGNEKNYADDIRTAIQKKMFNESDFSGKQCNVLIKMSKKGVIVNELQAEGYKPLCEAALNALRNADTPPAPDNLIYERFKSLAVQVKPG